jgi:hypothetical protein
MPKKPKWKSQLKICVACSQTFLPTDRRQDVCATCLAKMSPREFAGGKK